MQRTPFDHSKIRSLIADAESLLAGGPHPGRARRDAEALLLFVLRRNAPERNLAWLIAHDNSPTMPNFGVEFRALVQRRLAGEPIQYITGEAEFYGLPFHVNRDVLIPRPETEHLVEKAIALAEKLRLADANPEPRIPSLRIVDVGTGSGAISVALAHALPFAEITATDISPSALTVAKANAARNGFVDRVRFIEGDLLEPVVSEHFDIVVSNPPYVPASDRTALDVEVRDYEPAQALFAGEDGLAIYRRLIPAAFGALVPGGFLALEIGYGQQEAIHALLAGAGFSAIAFSEDLQKIPRVAVARRP